MNNNLFSRLHFIVTSLLGLEHVGEFLKKNENKRKLFCVYKKNNKKTFEANLAIAVYVGFAYHFVDFLVGQILVKIVHGRLELRRRDVAGAVLVEEVKRIAQLFVAIDSLRHHGQEFLEVNCATIVQVNGLDLSV